MDNYKDTILAQYANSPTITALVDFTNAWIDPAADLDSFYSYVFDVATAQGFGLDLIGKIVDIGRLIQVPVNQSYFGFKGDSSARPFNAAPFYSGPAGTYAVALSDDAYRTLILVKALANITDCTAQNLNKLLTLLFPGQRCYVADLGSMQLRYVFEFALTPVQMSIMTTASAIPRPAGVLAQIMSYDAPNTFGFAGSGGQNFNHGEFFNPATDLRNAQ